MRRIYQLISEFLGKVALSTLTSYSWVGMYEPEKPAALKKYMQEQNLFKKK